MKKSTFNSLLYILCYNVFRTSSVFYFYFAFLWIVYFFPRLITPGFHTLSHHFDIFFGNLTIHSKYRPSIKPIIIINLCYNATKKYLKIKTLDTYNIIMMKCRYFVDYNTVSDQ